jgi:hypothetical protein
VNRRDTFVVGAIHTRSSAGTVITPSSKRSGTTISPVLVSTAGRVFVLNCHPRTLAFSTNTTSGARSGSMVVGGVGVRAHA